MPKIEKGFRKSIEISRWYQYTSSDDTIELLWGKVFKNGPSKYCGRQPLKNLLQRN